MTPMLLRIALLANRDVFRDMGSGFREKRESFEPTDLIPWVIAIVGLFALLALLSRILARRDKSETFNSPRALFRALCKAHELDRRSRGLLKQLARHHQLAHESRLFLEPDRFEPANLSPALQAQRAALDSLQLKLFARETSAAGGVEATLAAASSSEKQVAHAGGTSKQLSDELVGLPMELPATYGPLGYEPRVTD